jgi:hypothetical protein
MKPLAFVLLLLASTSTWAGWNGIGSSSSADVYVDSATIRQQDTVVKIWSLLDFKTIQRVVEGSYLSQMAQQEYDCEAYTYRTLYGSLHSGNMGGGQVIFSSDEPLAAWEPIAPESVARFFWKIACGK